MKCPKCQFENREGAKFCNECGSRFEITCTQCGVANRHGSKFCDECGHDLRESAETSPIDYSQPQSYTPKYLADKILTTRSSIEGERKLVTVLFADGLVGDSCYPFFKENFGELRQGGQVQKGKKNQVIPHIAKFLSQGFFDFHHHFRISIDLCCARENFRPGRFKLTVRDPAAKSCAGLDQNVMT